LFEANLTITLCLATIRSRELPKMLVKVNEIPTNALIIQCISTQYSSTRFCTLKFHNQGVKHDPAEISVQCGGKQRGMEAVYCNRQGDDIQFITPPVTLRVIQPPYFSASHDIGHLSQQDHV
jgi:hypothetical protein